MSVNKPVDSRTLETFESVQNDIQTLAGQMLSLTVKYPKALVVLFAELLRPHGIPPTPLHEVLHQAANRASWTPPSQKAQRRQQIAAQARKIQREEDLALRRVFVSCIFKQLRPDLQKRPASLGTAQAIIGRLEKFPFPRKPPITVRTIQEDIRFLRENGNFGI